MELRWPSVELLASYVAAVERGFVDWPPPSTPQQQVERARLDPEGFVAALVDRDASGPAIELPDGTRARRLPGYVKWIWDGEVAGSIGFRWEPGTAALPEHTLGHVGYTVVPWRRREGLASAALAAILPDVAAAGLAYAELTTSPDNVASQRVIERNGGVLVERFRLPAAYGADDGLRYRITLDTFA